MSPRLQRLQDLRFHAEERRRLLERAERYLIEGDLLEAIDDVLTVVKMLSHAEETVMELHAECFSMLESAREVLRLDAERPVQIIIPKEQNGG